MKGWFEARDRYINTLARSGGIHGKKQLKEIEESLVLRSARDQHGNQFGIELRSLPLGLVDGR